MAKSSFGAEQLKSFVARVERLNEEKAALSADIREIYAEAQGVGFVPKIIRKVIRMRAMDKADLDEETALTDLYMAAVGLSGTPLGDFATREKAAAE